MMIFLASAQLDNGAGSICDVTVHTGLIVTPNAFITNKE
jgi:hypothetical protein